MKNLFTLFITIIILTSCNTLLQPDLNDKSKIIITITNDSCIQQMQDTIFLKVKNLEDQEIIVNINKFYFSGIVEENGKPVKKLHLYDPIKLLDENSNITINSNSQHIFPVYLNELYHYELNEKTKYNLSFTYFDTRNYRSKNQLLGKYDSEDSVVTICF